MACVITLDGKKYDEAGFKQLLASGFLVDEINSGVLADSKSGIYKQYINGNGTQEATSGEAQQAATQGQEAQGAGTEAGQTTPGTETANQIPGFDQLTTAQQQRFNSALDEINQSLDNKVSAREAFNKLMSYLGPDNIPFIVNMRAAIETSLDESRVSNLLKSLNKAGKTQIKGKLARTKVGQSLLNLSGSMKSLGFSMAVLSDEDFDNFVKEAYGLSATGQNALYAWGAKTMVLRASNTSQIALHEFTHPLLEIIEKTDPAAYASLVAEVRTIDSQEGTIHPEGMKFFEWAQKNYDRGTTETLDNEALTELVSVLADRRVSLSSPVGQAAYRVWNKIMAFFKIQATIDVKIDNTLTIDKLAKAISLAAITSRTIKVTNAAGVDLVTREGISSSKDKDLIADSGLSKYMTEDNNGNYVFYHRSNLDLTKKGIDPNKLGSNMRTGRDETMAKYPVSMYYTEPDIADVSGDYTHVVMIPKKKVYPADKDPLNLRPLAEKEFRKVFPNIAFDNNRAVSWIGKVAADKGYEMVVASWSPRRNFKALRAESVIKHKPKLFVKPSSGLGYGVDINEKYEFTSNRKSVSPTSTTGKSGVSSSKKISPLPGAPLNEVVSGPDEKLVNVAEQYARDNNIPYTRQPEYVKVDTDLAKRIADAYASMKHDPTDPKVKEAYDDLINQTIKQYEYLLKAGYKFSFFDSNTDPYKGSPWEAMKDLRDNKKMAVYGTYDGYGTEGVTGANIEENPMLRDTGYKWKDQKVVEHNVTANDLFRAVHDAFGHGLEGAGFRARGEENAWQAHVRLFTGPAVAAITTETRGQNSWLNYGPHGDKNRTAKLEDTVFAEQKTGLMPEWTWTEGRLSDGGQIDSNDKVANVNSKFAESAKLFDQIQEAEGSAKKRRLAEERRTLIESSPEVKFIDDNIKNIYEQLENKGVLKREGNCP